MGHIWAVPNNSGPLFRGAHNKDHIRSGSMLGLP